MSPAFCLGSLLAIYYFVGRWTFARLDGDYALVPMVEQPRLWLVVALVGCAAVLQNSVSRYARQFRPNRVDEAIVVFLAYMLLTSIWAPDWGLAGIKTFELALILTVALVIAASRSFGVDDQLHLGFWITVVMLGVALGLLSLVQGGDSRAYAPGGGPNTFGRNMGLTALGAVFLASRYGIVARIGGVGIVAMAALLVVRSGSRGGLLAFSIAAAVYIVCANLSVMRKALIIGAMGAATAIALFHTVVGQQAVEVFQGRIIEQTVENRYLAGRDDLWHQAIELARDRPLFGWGLDGFRANSWNYPHNLFLEVTVEGGLLGLLLLLNVGRVWLSQCKWGRSRIPRGPLVALALTFTAAQTSGDLFDSRGVFLMLALATSPIVELRPSLRRKMATRRAATHRLELHRHAQDFAPSGIIPASRASDVERSCPFL
jgi:O-antigen ligase